MKPEDRLDDIPFDPKSDRPAPIQKALWLARKLQSRGNELQTPQEKRQQAEYERMMCSAQDKATLTQMTDQAFRAKTPRRAADQLTHILDIQGVPRFFNTVERTLLKGFQSFGSYLPGVSMPEQLADVRSILAPVFGFDRRVGVS